MSLSTTRAIFIDIFHIIILFSEYLLCST